MPKTTKQKKAAAATPKKAKPPKMTKKAAYTPNRVTENAQAKKLNQYTLFVKEYNPSTASIRVKTDAWKILPDAQKEKFRKRALAWNEKHQFTHTGTETNIKTNSKGVTTGTITNTTTNSKGVTHTTTKTLKGKLETQPIFNEIMRVVENKAIKLEYNHRNTAKNAKMVDRKPIFDGYMREMQDEFNRNWNNSSKWMDTLERQLQKKRSR